ncbi:Non-reducing end beta-L-arabinofuranosidase [Massilia sp. Bi118]|uniref:glycoside hydrolase family 127 protein n=1 Tax=Massilia sp. Bi118 TaxID=2822346 RepID=UPI001DD44FC4|nr:glycoside hydrolase family 127 protein [Massilia sp. Bi118]CAH0280618.1 Non-reducing end beta-L-arabinofuranosidase [Massilia sp. Bi118]
MTLKRIAALLLAFGAASAQAAELFPLRDVRLGPSPFLDAQATDLHYLMAMEPDRLLAPFLREAGLEPKRPSYGNWESTGLDGHMGGHYLSALALMYASTGDAGVKERLDYFVAELKRAQQANGDGYLGGIPGGRAAWREVAAGKLHADNFSVNGKWVPWYNLHKIYAGLRDAWRYGGSEDARAMLIGLSDWALRLTSHLTDAQMQSMLKSEHGGMNEVLADVYQMTGQRKYLDLALKFSHQAILQPLEKGEDRLTGLHANTQIPKVIGFKRIADLSGDRDMERAAAFFWQTVVEHRTVAIGGNSVKEHFHDDKDFSPMIEEVEGPETCNTYNMLKLSEMLFASSEKAQYADYYERALYNHILGSQRPGTGGFVYFTPMRPNQYRVYSQVDQAMWCCVGSGIESHAKYGEFIYAHDGDALFVNLFIPSTLRWREKGVQIVQANRFPDQAGTRIRVEGDARFTMKIRYPAWVAPGKLAVRVNGRLVKVTGKPGEYVSIDRAWRTGDRIDVSLPMTTRLEQMPDKSNYYAVMHGPIVLAAKTNPFPTEHLNFLADDSRMGHIASGQVCPLESAPTFVSDRKDFMRRFRPVKGKPLTFTAPGLVQGGAGSSTEFIPFFRLHDSRYMVYWQQSTPGDFARMRAENAAKEAERLALDARTIDQVAPGEQQPESDHFFQGEGAEAGVNTGRHWRHATKWFSYRLNDPKGEARVLRLGFARADAGRRFDILVNGERIAEVELAGDATEAFYTRDFALPAASLQQERGALEVKFLAKEGSLAGGLYGLKLLR